MRQKLYMKKVFVVCSTYRDPAKPSPAREIGLVSVLDQVTTQNFDGQIYLAVVDSSPEPHTFYQEIIGVYPDNLLYLHVPDRNQKDPNLAKQLPWALSFLPSDRELAEPIWQRRTESVAAWSRFFPWDKDYPIKYNMAEHPFRPRPALGMKRNAGIAAMTEKFGEADVVVFADDDDFRSPDYIKSVCQGLGAGSFTRMSNYLTCAIETAPDETQWGLHNVPFTKDINGIWSPTEEVKDIRLLNSSKTDFGATVADRFNPLLTLGVSPMSFEGALHVYSYDHWKKSVEAFGGVPPVSMCDDILYYRQSKDEFGSQFIVNHTAVSDPSFIRTCSVSNASVIEWTQNLEQTDVPPWALDHIAPIQTALSDPSFDVNGLMQDCANGFKKDGKIDLNPPFPQRSLPARGNLRKYNI